MAIASGKEHEMYNMAFPFAVSFQEGDHVHVRALFDRRTSDLTIHLLAVAHSLYVGNVNTKRVFAGHLT